MKQKKIILLIYVWGRVGCGARNGIRRFEAELGRRWEMEGGEEEVSLEGGGSPGGGGERLHSEGMTQAV